MEADEDEQPTPEEQVVAEEAVVENEDPQEPEAHEEDQNVEEPRDLLCPLTFVMFREPCVIASGATYELDAVERFLTQTQRLVDPGTNAPLANRHVTINLDMRRRVVAWLDAHPHHTPEGWDGRELPPLVESEARAAALAAVQGDPQWQWLVKPVREVIAVGGSLLGLYSLLPWDTLLYCLLMGFYYFGVHVNARMFMATFILSAILQQHYGALSNIQQLALYLCVPLAITIVNEGLHATFREVLFQLKIDLVEPMGEHLGRFAFGASRAVTRTIARVHDRLGALLTASLFVAVLAMAMGSPRAIQYAKKEYAERGVRQLKATAATRIFLYDTLASSVVPGARTSSDSRVSKLVCGAYNAQVNGKLVGGAYTYVKHGDGNTMLWYAEESGCWNVGPATDVGKPKGYVSMCVGASKHSKGLLVPEHAPAGKWQCGGDKEWCKALRVGTGKEGQRLWERLHGEKLKPSKKEGERLEQAAKNVVLVRATTSTGAGGGAKWAGDVTSTVEKSVLGIFIREDALVNGRHLYRHALSDDIALWFTPKLGGVWGVSKRELINSPHGPASDDIQEWFYVYSKDTALLPEHIEASFERFDKDGTTTRLDLSVLPNCGNLKGPIGCNCGEGCKAASGGTCSCGACGTCSNCDSCDCCVNVPALANATSVRLRGNFPEKGVHNVSLQEWRGPYEPTNQVWRGRYVYVSVDGSDKALWYASKENGWNIGPRDCILKGCAYFYQPNEVSLTPEAATSKWQVNVGDGKGGSKWVLGSANMRMAVVKPPAASSSPKL